MDKKLQKRIAVVRQRLQNRRQQLASAKKQPDEPQALERLTREVAELEAELARLQQ